MTAACGAPQLAAPPEVTAPPTTAAPEPDFPTCTPEEAELDPTRSYAPDGPLPTPGEMPAGTTMAEIQDRGRLIVGVSADTLQFGALDADRQPEGFDIDMLKEVAKAIFGEGGEDQIEYRVMPYAGRLPSLEDDEVDLVAHTMTINCDRWKRIAFSSTYYDAGQKVLVPTSSNYESVDDLVVDGATVCVPAATTNEQEITKPEYTGPRTAVLASRCYRCPTSPTASSPCSRGRRRRSPATTRCSSAWPPRTPTCGSSANPSPRSRTASACAPTRSTSCSSSTACSRTCARTAGGARSTPSGSRRRPDVPPPAPPEPVYGR